jgi:hypothetical protein
MFESKLNNTTLNLNATNYQSGIYFIQYEKIKSPLDVEYLEYFIYLWLIKS